MALGDKTSIFGLMTFKTNSTAAPHELHILQVGVHLTALILDLSDVDASLAALPVGLPS